MSKNKKENEKTTNSPGEKQNLSRKRRISSGVDKRGGQSPK